MRVTRLLSIVFEVDARPGITASELAESLDVSVRTIYRDVAALQAAGVPLFGVVGRNGGLHLVEGYRSTASALRADEAAALLAGTVPGVADQLGLGGEAERATRKVQRQHGASTGRGSPAAGQVLVDPIGWYRSPDEAPHLALLAGAMRTNTIVAMRYSRWVEPDRPVRRRIAPHGLVLKAGTWYVMARSRRRMRTYRVDQILDARLTADRFVPEEDFDLPASWAAFLASFGDRLHVVDVHVRLDRPTRDRIRREGDRALCDALVRDVDEDIDDDEREVVLPFESVERAVAELLRFGPGVEVDGPAEVRERIAEVASSIAQRYAVS